MSIMQKKVILIGAGFLILLLTFFLVFQPNQETVSGIDAETLAFQNKVNHLNGLQRTVNMLERTSQSKQTETVAFTREFPCRVPQEKAIYNLYLMMKESKIRITAITPGEAQTFLQEGVFVASAQSSAAASGTAVEQDPERKVNLNQMVGKFSRYDIQVTGTFKQIMKAIDWIGSNKENMTIWKINLSYDSGTGKLSGNIILSFNELNGNGKEYVEPDISDISLSMENVGKIFGTSKK